MWYSAFERSGGERLLVDLPMDSRAFFISRIAPCVWGSHKWNKLCRRRIRPFWGLEAFSSGALRSSRRFIETEEPPGLKIWNFWKGLCADFHDSPERERGVVVNFDLKLKAIKSLPANKITKNNWSHLGAPCVCASGVSSLGWASSIVGRDTHCPLLSRPTVLYRV